MYCSGCFRILGFANFLAILAFAMSEGVAQQSAGYCGGAVTSYIKCGLSTPPQFECAASGTCSSVTETINGVDVLWFRCSINGSKFNFYMADYTKDFPAGSAETGFVWYENKEKPCYVRMECVKSCTNDLLHPPMCQDNGGTFNTTTHSIPIVESNNLIDPRCAFE